MKIKILTALVILVIASSSASASLIDANVVKGKPTLSIGFSALDGFGLVSSMAFPVDSRMSIGGSFGYNFETGNPYLFDLNMNLQFVEPTAKSPFSASVIGGVWGGTSDGIWLSKRIKEAYIQPEFGVSLGLMFNSRMTGRMNLVYGPTLGVELGYLITPGIEGIFAISEQVIGVKFKIF